MLKKRLRYYAEVFLYYILDILKILWYAVKSKQL